MKVLLLSKYRQLEIAEAATPVLGQGEVLIRVAACGICGSDVHGYDGSSGRRIPPIVMGHEAAGTIAALGPGVNGFAQGDRVTFDSTIYCGACGPCLRGHVNLCDKRQVLGVSCTEYRRAGASRLFNLSEISTCKSEPVSFFKELPAARGVVAISAIPAYLLSRRGATVAARERG